MITALAIIIALIPLGAWAALIAWSPTETEGELLLGIPITLYGRIKMLAVPVALGMLIAILAWVLRVMPWWGVALVGAAHLVVLSIPISYTLTTTGIRAGHGQFRRWTEFAGVQRSRPGALLQGAQGKHSYPIFLSGGPDDDEFVLTLKNLVRDSYKGKSGRGSVVPPGTID